MRGIDRLYVLIGDLEAVLHIGAHVLQDYVCLGRESHESLMPLLGFQVQRDGALVAMQVLEVEAVAAAGDVLRLLDRRLDPDHVGAPVGEMTHRGRPRASEGQVQHR